MRKIYWKKAVVLAAAVLAGMQAAGCGSKEENTTAQKEFVYVPEYQELDLENGVNGINVIGDTVYLLTGELDEASGAYIQYLGVLKADEKTPEMVPLEIGKDASLSGLSADMNGNLVGVVTTSLYDDSAGSADGAEDAAVDEAEGGAEDAAADEAEDGAEEAAADETEGGAEDAAADEAEAGSADGTEDAAADEMEAGTADETEAGTGDAVSEESTTVIVNGGGRRAATYIAGSDGSDGDYRAPVSQLMEVYVFSPEGKVVSKVALPEELGQNGSYIQYIQTDKDGNIYLTYDQTIEVLDKDGKELFKTEIDNWINGMFTTKDGEVLVTYYGTENMEVHKIDPAAKTLGDKLESLMVSDWGNYTFAKGVDTDLLLSVDNDLYSYNFAEEAPVKLLNWVDCDIDSNELSAFAALEDGRILAVTNSWNNPDGVSTTELVYLTKKKGSEVPEKKILTFGTMSLGYDIKKQIIDFNKKNQEYRIEIKEYLSNYTEEAFKASREQLNADIVSGKCPDIIDLSDGNMDSYAAKGILEDLYPYIDADPEMNREDYLENVMKAYETDGKLYTLPSRIYISTVIAKTADVGDRKSITADELMKMYDALPEGTDLYDYATKDMILMYNTMMNMDEYVNWTTGECKFDREDFIKAMEFANRFDTEIDYNQERPSSVSRIRDNTLKMINTSIASVEQYQMYKGMFGEPITLIGFPTTKENGSFIGGGTSQLGMSAKSPNKDGVWQFLRKGITKEEQEKDDARMGNYGFPVMKSALELQFKRDMEEEYYEDADGTKHKQPKTTWGYDDLSIEIYAASEEEVAAVRDLIESVTSLYQYDEQINNIIMEESKAYFEGQKSAKDAADIIQSRVQIYVNENR